MAGTPAAEIAVDERLVRKLLASQYPHYSNHPLSFCGEGWDNFTFRLGDDLAIRLPRRKVAVSLLLNEQRCLGLIAPSLPLPVPAPLAIGEPGSGFPWRWSIIPWIEGAPVDQAPLDPDQGPVLAAFLRALHRQSPADAPTNPARGVRLEARRERFDECLDRLRASSDFITPAIGRAWLEALAAPVRQTPVWLHGDMHAQNVLSKDGKIAGVIDWGDMCGGDPAVDLGCIWTLLGDRSAREATLRAYAPEDALLARSHGWAVLFGATLYENGRVDNPRHAAIGETTLRRLAEDL
jgi:aminoglycoside phosphotransferase (APT) family kinase protein